MKPRWRAASFLFPNVTRPPGAIFSSMPDSIDKPNFSQGWGIAGFITALAIGAFILAGVIKKNTFHSPNDPLGPAPEAAASHGAAEKAAPEAH